ncbi:MAG: HDOD domain-containing protein [Fusobacteria bacterium]|nr:HDOD domain-containing protein [Fusobacteriota bacterium]
MSQNSEHVKKILATLDDIPTLPLVINRLMELLENPKSTAKDINDVIKTDQSLTAKTLKLVNSAYYGFPRKIGTVTDAVVILGFNTVRSLALSATVCKLFSGEKTEYFDRAELWEHSMAVAFASRLIAKKVRYPEQEEAFVAGLLHDIAKVIEDQYFHDIFIEAVKMSKDNGISLIDAEREVIGMDHSLIGRRIADKWNLPFKVTKVIGYHHQPEFGGIGDEKILTSIVHVADSVVKLRKIGNSGNYGPIVLDKSAVELLKITKQDLAEVVKKLLIEMEKAADFLKIVKE